MQLIDNVKNVKNILAASVALCACSAKLCETNLSYYTEVHREPLSFAEKNTGKMKDLEFSHDR